MRALVVLVLVFGCCLCVSAQTTVIGVAATAGTPVFSPAAGSIASGTQISMSTTPSACNSYIYWNFTGTSMPSGTNSTTSSAITTSSTLYAQVIGCPGYINSSIGSAAYTIIVSNVTIDSTVCYNGAGNSGTGSAPCSNITTGCVNGGDANVCRIESGWSVPTVADSVAIFAQTCWNSSCTKNSAGTLTATDGTNTGYTQQSVSTFVSGSPQMYVLTMCNLTNVSNVELDITNSDGTATWYYQGVSVVFFKNANPSTCLDTNITNAGDQTTGATVSMTSAGNVSASGEAIAAASGYDTTFSNSGSCTTGLNDTTTGIASLYTLNPSSGSGVTCAFTQTSGYAAWTMIGMKH